MQLFEALGLEEGGVVAAVGAGGKTTLVYSLAREAHARGLRTLVTSTTHMGTPLPEPVLYEEDDDQVEKALAESGCVTLLGKPVRSDKVEGIDPERVDALSRIADLVLVEADGARGRSLKVPAPHEPVIPKTARWVIVLAGLDSLGRPLEEALVHRLSLVLEAAGRREGETLDEEAFVKVLTSRSGYLSRTPKSSRTAVFLNKAELIPIGRDLVTRLAPPFDLALCGSARTGEVFASRKTSD